MLGGVSLKVTEYAFSILDKAESIRLNLHELMTVGGPLIRFYQQR